MIAKKWFAALGFVAIMLVAAVFAQTQKSGLSRGWKFVEVELSATQSAAPTLNKYGADGWELVNVVPGCVVSESGAGVFSTKCNWYAYFKRQK